MSIVQTNGEAESSEPGEAAQTRPNGVCPMSHVSVLSGADEVVDSTFPRGTE